MSNVQYHRFPPLFPRHCLSKYNLGFYRDSMRYSPSLCLPNYRCCCWIGAFSQLCLLVGDEEILQARSNVTVNLLSAGVRANVSTQTNSDLTRSGALGNAISCDDKPSIRHNCKTRINFQVANSPSALLIQEVERSLCDIVMCRDSDSTLRNRCAMSSPGLER